MSKLSYSQSYPQFPQTRIKSGKVEKRKNRKHKIEKKT